MGALGDTWTLVSCLMTQVSGLCFSNARGYDGCSIVRQLLEEKTCLQLITQGVKLMCKQSFHFHRLFYIF